MNFNILNKLMLILIICLATKAHSSRNAHSGGNIDVNRLKNLFDQIQKSADDGDVNSKTGKRNEKTYVKKKTNVKAIETELLKLEIRSGSNEVTVDERQNQTKKDKKRKPINRKENLPGRIGIAGKHKTILIETTEGESDNYYRYLNEVNLGKAVLEYSGSTPIIMSGDDTNWKVSPQYDEDLYQYEVKKGQLERKVVSKEDAKKLVKNTSFVSLNNLREVLDNLNTSPGESILLFINGHGLSEDNITRKSGDSRLAMWGAQNCQKTNWNDFVKVLKSYPFLNFQVVSTLCYGGGVHILSRKLDNVCTAAMTSHLSESSSGQMDMTIFTNKFWDKFRHQKGQIPFGDLALYSLKHDPSNIGQGKISSLDYIDFILKTGPYLQNTIPFKTKIKTVQDDSGNYLCQIQPPNEFSSFICAEKFDSDYVIPPDHYLGCDPTPEFVNLEKYNKLVRSIRRKGLWDDLMKNMPDFVKLLPPFIFENYIDKIVYFIDKATDQEIIKFFRLLACERRQIISST